MEVASKENIYNTLSFISDLLRNSHIEWFVIGKTNLFLQGLDLNPSKIGILIHIEDLDTFLEVFREYISSSVIDLDNEEAKEFFMDIFAARVQVCAEYPNGTYWKFKKDIIDISINNLTINGFSLVAEAQIYRIFGKLETEKQITRFLESKNS